MRTPGKKLSLVSKNTWIRVIIVGVVALGCIVGLIPLLKWLCPEFIAKLQPFGGVYSWVGFVLVIIGWAIAYSWKRVQADIIIQQSLFETAEKLGDFFGQSLRQNTEMAEKTLRRRTVGRIILLLALTLSSFWLIFCSGLVTHVTVYSVELPLGTFLGGISFVFFGGWFVWDEVKLGYALKRVDALQAFFKDFSKQDLEDSPQNIRNVMRAILDICMIGRKKSIFSWAFGVTSWTWGSELAPESVWFYVSVPERRCFATEDIVISGGNAGAYEPIIGNHCMRMLDLEAWKREASKCFEPGSDVVVKCGKLLKQCRHYGTELGVLYEYNVSHLAPNLGKCWMHDDSYLEKIHWRFRPTHKLRSGVIVAIRKEKSGTPLGFLAVYSTALSAFHPVHLSYLRCYAKILGLILAQRTGGPACPLQRAHEKE
jgi:hypothetical protein